MNDKRISVLFCLALFLFLFLSCGKKESNTVPQESPSLANLSSAYEDDFFIGAALGAQHIVAESEKATDLIATQFNSITPENVMKWMYIQPGPDSFYFDMADKFVAMGEEMNMHIVGHALVWHSQIAPYMSHVNSRDSLISYMTEHITTIVNRYKGKIDAWDVVNEAFNEDGSYRESDFYKILGDEYIELAFTLASQADPDAKLIYNDYNLWKPLKRDGVVKLVKQLQSKGIKIDAVGLQGHYSLIGPDVQDIENSVRAFAELGVEVMFTELDVTALPNPWDLEGAEVSQNFEGSEYMNPYTTGLPDSMQTKLTERYADLFTMFLKHSDDISRVTFWGLNDGHTWLNNWPIEGRTNHPLFWDRSLDPKPVYAHILDLPAQIGSAHD